ncbi:MAG: DUF1178 family protein [Rhizobiales bacterium]|nr:DUF1178 family protein [Hyphomicrobiales bacterium]
MIRYDLVCKDGHSFDSWFRDSDAYDKLVKAGQVSCTVCGSSEVEKALMVPGIPSRHNKYEPTNQQMVAGPQNAQQRELMDAVRRLRKQVSDNADYVGEQFPEEARKMHYGETEERGIYGEASVDEAKELVEEGIKVAPLPKLPEEAN